LPGDAPPYTYVELRRCFADMCYEWINSQPADNQGQFLFVNDAYGRPILPGTYQVYASAYEFQSNQTDPFEVAAGENKDVGDIALVPPPLRFSDIHACLDLPPQGGLCRYSVQIDNNTRLSLKGRAWSLVDAQNIGSRLNYSTFQVQEPRQVSIDALGSRTVNFNFDVPGTVNDGAFYCTRIFFGEGHDPFFNTWADQSLFCITKGVSGFRIVSDIEAKKLVNSLKGHPQPVPGVPLPQK